MKPALVVAFALSLTASAASARTDRWPPGSARRGLAFAQSHCATCHAIGFNAASPNPESPPFPDIANRAGVTRATLERFLWDSHNYPEAMKFTIDHPKVHDLVAYFLTLKRRHYRPEI